MLQVKKMTKEYRSNRRAPVCALQNVSLTFADTGLVFILGKSGSGKSTLLHILGGLDTPTAGEVVVDGKPMRGFKERELDDYRNAYVGFVFQEYNLLERESVGKNVALALELQGGQEDRAKIENVLRQVDLVDGGQTLYERPVRELSGGQRQRVAIARALVKDPKVILADEPTGALDSKTGKQLYELLKALSKERLVVVVTHDEASAKAYGDRIIELADGEVVSDTLSADEEQQVKNEAAPSGQAPLRGKGGLPFRRVLAMGADGLRHKRLRLAISILLSAVAFFMFGFTLTASFSNRYKTEFQTLYDRGMQMVTVSLGESVAFSSEKWELLAEYCGKEPILVYHPWRYEIDLTYIAEFLGAEDVYGSENPYVNAGTSVFEYFAELDPQTGEQDANLRPDDRFTDSSLCRLPQTYNEIAITDMRADMFIKFGYRETDGTVMQIKTPDDLIGKQLGEFTICGVYMTEMDGSFLKSHDIDNDPDYQSIAVNTASNSARDGIISYGFVKKGFLAQRTDEWQREFAMIKLQGDVPEDMRLIDDLAYSEKGEEFRYEVKVMSGVSGEVQSIADIIDLIIEPAKIAAAVFCVFAALLQMNFLSVSLDRKKREFGILRALGAKKKDVIAICLTESLLIALIDLLLSAAAVVITCLVINGLYSCALLIPGALQIGSMLLLGIGVAALSAILPAVRIGKQKPIDVIRSIE